MKNKQAKNKKSEKVDGDDEGESSVVREWTTGPSAASTTSIIKLGTKSATAAATHTNDNSLSEAVKAAAIKKGTGPNDGGADLLRQVFFF